MKCTSIKWFRKEIPNFRFHQIYLEGRKEFFRPQKICVEWSKSVTDLAKRFQHFVLGLVIVIKIIFTFLLEPGLIIVLVEFLSE